MRVLAIGDIHGCLTALTTLLDMIQLRPDDQLITLGDYVDRGPNSRGVIDLLLKLRQAHALVALRGNHDQMMLAAPDDPHVRPDWLSWGGKATLQSYARVADKPGTLDDVPESHWDFLKNRCVLWHETGSHFFVHANVLPDVPLEQQPEFMLLWEKIVFPLPHISGKIMVCGHTAQKNGLPLNLGHTLCIDTWVYGDGWLTCVDVLSGQVWQANERGQRRTFNLGETLLA